MFRVVLALALLAVALAAFIHNPFYGYGPYGGDENRDRVPDALDGNRDGQVDGAFYGGFPFGYGGLYGYPNGRYFY